MSSRNKNISFEDNSIKIKDILNDQCISYLYEAAGELEAQVKRNTAVDSGQLKSSWTHHVSEASLTATVGSPLENAIWEEFGTGEYALNGDGRKTPWVYQDRKGVWHKTTGKYPKRAFQKTFTNLKPKLINRFADIISKGFK